MEDQHYSSEDEEVFFGSLANSEISKRRHFLGSNYNSPVTPRPPRSYHASSRIQENVPGNLGASSTSTPVQRQPLVVSCRNNQSTHVESGGSPRKESDDDDVIVLDCSRNSDSIIILSDDESFMINEKTCTRMSLRSNGESQSLVKEPASTSEMSNESESVEVKIHHESVFSDKDFIVEPDDIFEDNTLSKFGINNSANGSLQSHNSSLKSIEMNSLHVTVNKSNDSVCSVENDRSSLVQDIDVVKNKNVVKEVGSFCEVSNKDTTAGVNNVCSGSFLSDKICLTESVVNEDKDVVSFLDNDETNSFVVKTNESYKYNMEKSISSIVQDINDFVGDSSILEKCSAPVNHDTVDNSSFILNDPQNLTLSTDPSSSEENDPNPSSGIVLDSTSSVQPSELHKNTKIIGEMSNNSAKNHGNNSFDMSGLSNLEFSLNGITDSILNISHGSSLPSPPETCLPSSPVYQNPNIYEDISYDDAQLEESTHVSNITGKNNQENKDLHMSVDEVNFQQHKFSDDFVTLCTLGTSIETSQTSEYKSCPSSHSSYNTANNRTSGGNHSNSEQSDPFQNYRDISSELNMCKETDSVGSKSDEENMDECSFEMPVQNTQNTSVSEMSSTNKEEPKAMSKLPVYQNSKSLLRPPKLYVKPDILKSTSHKFAKQISKLESEKCTSNIPKPGMLKFTGPKPLNANKDAASDKEKKTPLVKGRTFTKTPVNMTPSNQNLLSKTKTPMSSSSLSKLKTPSLSYLPVMKTPDILSNTPTNLAVKKTPAQNKSGIPKAVKSDSKVPRLLTPLSRCYSTEKICGSSQKNKYKNVISPIHAYIRGSPPVPLRNGKVKEEEYEVYDPSGKKICQSTSQNTTPMKSQNATPMKFQNAKPMRSQNAIPMKSAPRAVQILKYENTQGQENVNPNLINLTRDTIQSKVLEPSLQVFWKEQEESRLPKMGEKITKILTGTPKVKLTVHNGRVNQTPSSNGILIPNKEDSPTSFIAPSDSPHTSNADNVHEGRISIRVQKTMELP